MAINTMVHLTFLLSLFRVVIVGAAVGDVYHTLSGGSILAGFSKYAQVLIAVG
ncbi:MAG: hypothetical protein V4603_11690 [Pseudomonadota bacterium]